MAGRGAAPTGWRFAALLREATKNALTAGGGAYVVLCLAVLAGSGAVAYEAHRAATFHDAVEEVRLAGRNLISLGGADPEATSFEIDRRSCEALVTTPGVNRAGAIVPLEEVDTEQFGPFVPVTQVSSQLVADLAEGRVVVGSAFGTPGQRLTISMDGSPAPAVVGRRQPDVTGLNSSIAVLLPTSTQWVPTCLVELDPYRRSADLVPALTAQLVTHGGPVAAHEAYDGPQDVVQQYRSDLARFLPWVLAAFCAILSVIRTWAGASTSAAYRLSGTTPSSHTVLLTLEQVLVAGAFVAAGSLAVLVLEPHLVAPTAVLLRVVQAGLLWVVLYAVGVAPMLRADPTVLAKDR